MWDSLVAYREYAACVHWQCIENSSSSRRCIHERTRCWNRNGETSMKSICLCVGKLHRFRNEREELRILRIIDCMSNLMKKETNNHRRVVWILVLVRKYEMTVFGCAPQVVTIWTIYWILWCRLFTVLLWLQLRIFDRCYSICFSIWLSKAIMTALTVSVQIHSNFMVATLQNGDRWQQWTTTRQNHVWLFISLGRWCKLCSSSKLHDNNNVIMVHLMSLPVRSP